MKISIKDMGILLLGIAAVVFVSKPAEKKLIFDKHDYQLIQLGDMVRNQFIIDKETGRIWNKICLGEVAGYGECKGELYWSEMYIETVTPEDSATARMHNMMLQDYFSKNASKKKN